MCVEGRGGGSEACQFKGISSAAIMKSQRRTAKEAKDCGCCGKEIYALCAKFKLGKFGIVGEEGTPCVTSDGKFGVVHAKDKDNRGPWIISGVHPDQVSSIDIICRIRPLRWALTFQL